jgi:glucosylceramidase
MKTLLSVSLLVLLVLCGSFNKQALKIEQQVVTTEGHYWQVKTSSDALEISSASNPKKYNIQMDKPGQTIDGFGGCFNEMGWEVLQTLPEDERNQVFESLFGMEEGCRFTLYRVPIGANDYAVEWYSHNETPMDLSMEHFSIERDQQRLIPYIRKAMDYNPDLKIFASPWCPPLWMKTNGHYACRSDIRVNDLADEKQGKEMVDQFIMEDSMLDAYALYFSKFISAYKNEGIRLYSVHVQNEPNSCQNFPSCVWTPASLARFIGKHLGPKLKEDHPEIELWLGTIERPHPERVDEILMNEDAKRYIDGAGFQWAGKEVIGYVRKQYPHLSLMQTETECGNGSNDWAAMEYTFNLMKHYFANGVSSYLYWNMVLDHTGSSQWGWRQNAMITIDENRQAVYNPEFYLMKHVSYFVKKGARYLTCSDDNSMVFLNSDNKLVIVTYNPLDIPEVKRFILNNNQIETTCNPKALSTLVVQL